jgi:hypothetical protein
MGSSSFKIKTSLEHSAWILQPAVLGVEALLSVPGGLWLLTDPPEVGPGARLAKQAILESLL